MSNNTKQAASTLREFALAYPATHEDFPWGERVIKVNQKIFVFMGHASEGLHLSVKLPESHVRALDLPFTQPAGYGMGKHGWVSASFEPRDAVPLDLLCAWIDESYRAVAPKRLVAGLAANVAKAPEKGTKTVSAKPRGKLAKRTPKKR